MPSSPPNFRSLKFIAELGVDEAFEGDSVSTFRSAFQLCVGDYVTIVSQAGDHAARLVGQLPYAEEEGGFEGAFMGAYILRQTEQALRELLEEDDEMRAMIEAYYTTTAAEDAAASREAQQFDRDHHADRNGEFRESAKGFVDQVAPELEISNSAGTANMEAGIASSMTSTPRKIEVQVYEETDTERVPTDAKPAAPAESAPSPDDLSADAPIPIERPSLESASTPLLEELPAVPVSVNPTADAVSNADSVSDSSLPPEQVPSSADMPPAAVAEPLDPALKMFGERPVRIEIEAPNYSSRTPNSAFTSAVTWMVDHIIMVASGSKSAGKYPRIAPLMMADIPQGYAAPLAEMERVTKNIRHHAARLRLPGDEGGGFPDLARKFLDLDPSDSAAVSGAVNDLMNRLRSGGASSSDESDYAASAREDGGWKESDGEDWK